MPAHPAIPLVAFLDGTAVPIEEVPDPVFAGRMMGDGVAIDPDVATASLKALLSAANRAGGVTVQARTEKALTTAG